jgi:4-amino-4-deoxychorismate lyase
MTSPSQYLINGYIRAGLSPVDRGLSYGDGIFRTLRVCLQAVQTEPGSWALHYKKLEQDCKALAITCPSAELLLSDIRQLFPLKDEGVAKIIITRGETDRGYAISNGTHTTRIIIKTPIPIYPTGNFTEGVRLHLCQLRLSAQPRLAGIKHLNRLENVLARMEWTDSNIAEGLMLDENGLAIECTMSNLFARFNTRLVTPNLNKCGVAGVTRDRILEAASGLGLEAEIADLTLENLMQADEILICNSLYGVWQVSELDNQCWQPQRLAKRLRQILQA